MKCTFCNKDVNSDRIMSFGVCRNHGDVMVLFHTTHDVIHFCVDGNELGIDYEDGFSYLRKYRPDTYEGGFYCHKGYDYSGPSVLVWKIMVVIPHVTPENCLSSIDRLRNMAAFI